MKILVNLLFIDMNIETYLLEVNNSTSLYDAKKIIQQMSCVYPEEQYWFCNNSPITQIEWSEKSKYSIIVKNIWYNFNIKIFNDSIQINHLKSKDLVSTLKYHIFMKKNLSPDAYTLNYINSNKNIILQDNDYIGKYIIPNNSTINLFIKIKAGFK